MKTINDFISEKLIINSKTKIVKTDYYLKKIPAYKIKGIEELVNVFNDTILNNQTLQEEDFEKIDDNTFNICKVPQDGELAKKFFEKRSSLSKTSVRTSSNFEHLEIEIIWLSTPIGEKDIREYIKVNVEFNNYASVGPLGKWIVRDIISVDVSENVKYMLLYKNERNK